MDITTEVRPGANRYASGANILQNLPSYLADFKKISVITGEKSSEAFKKYYRKELHYPTYRYDGSSSHENAVELATQIGHAELILAIGGGRVIDTAKMVAEELNAELMVIPTLISNCAPFTPIVAVYHPNRTFKAMGFMKRAPFLTLVDSNFLLATPKDYAIPAIKDLENHQATSAFSRVTDTIIGLAGETGGFAASYGRSGGAHAVHDGLSYLEATHNQLHGMKVAYGILVQLAHTKDLEEIEKLRPFYKKIGLPLKLKDLEVFDTSKSALTPVIEHAASSNETFNMVDPHITADQIYRAIQTIEFL